MSKTKRNLRVAGLLFIVIGLALMTRNQLFVHSAVRVVAMMGTMSVGPEDYEEEVPVYNYKFAGKDYKSRGHVAPKDGESKVVIIFVNPENPTEILVDRFWERWLWIMMSTGLGIVLWGMGNQKGKIRNTEARDIE